MTFLLAMFAILKIAARPNGNILLGVTLPYEALGDSRTAEIINKYRKAYRVVVLIFLIFAVPVPFFAEYSSITMIYLFVLCCAMVYFYTNVFNRHFSELYSLKRENEWWVGEQNIISIDTEVSRLKDTFMLSKKWFALPFAVSLIPVVYGLIMELTGAQFWTVAGAGVFNVLTVFLLHYAIGSMKTKTYSENTEVNIALNHVFKREWSKCFFIMALLMSGTFTVMTFMAVGAVNEIVILVFVFLLSFATIIPGVHTHTKIRAARNKMLLIENETVYADDDQYWRMVCTTITRMIATHLLKSVSGLV